MKRYKKDYLEFTDTEKCSDSGIFKQFITKLHPSWSYLTTINDTVTFTTKICHPHDEELNKYIQL